MKRAKVQRATVIGVCAFSLASVLAMETQGQRVYSNSRSPGLRRVGQSTGTYRFGTDRRWGQPAYNGQPAPSRSPDWTLRPTYNSSRSTAPRYDAAPARRSPTYSYGNAPWGRHSYSNYYGPVDYRRRNRNLGFIYQTPVFPGYGTNYIGFGGVIAPPIIVPYGGYTSPFLPVPGHLNFGFPLGSANTIPSATVAGLPPTTKLAPEPQKDGEALSTKMSVDETPVIDEFGAPNVDRKLKVATVDRIRSLRYQSSGDAAFRKQDYASAATLYRTAADTAPIRQAPWIRLAWAQLAEQKFDEAARSLKTGLVLPDDPTSSWIGGKSLYGQTFNTTSVAHGDELWEWLHARPNSTDRLLLASAFHELRGYPGIARELALTAKGTGLPTLYADSLHTLCRDIADLQAADEAAPADAEFNAIVSPLPRDSASEPGGGSDAPKATGKVVPLLPIPQLNEKVSD